ncbi:MAG: hypothetical protein JW929_00290 [Anaerolineales bacterium]|nr:hypothetical protein [Anaerolineales bacterium]
MVAFLTFLQDYQMVAFYLLGLIGLRFLILFIAAQYRVSKAKFGLEQELSQGQRNSAAAKFLIAAAAGVAIHAAVQYGLPEARRAEQIRISADSAGLPTITPTATPFELFGVDVSGCTNPNARILDPEPGDAVKGRVTIQIVAAIEKFAFFKLELGTPEEPDVWVLLHTNNPSGSAASQPGSKAEPGSFSWEWDSTTVNPGVYHLRLTVFRDDLSYPTPCVIPIQVLAPDS